MAKRNPLKNTFILVVIAIVLLLVAFFVIKPLQDKRESEKDRSSLLFPDFDRQKIVELKIANPNGIFEIKKRAEKTDSWSVVFDGKSFEADKASVDGLISTIIAAKKEGSIDSKAMANLGLEPPKFKLLVSEGSEATAKELQLGEDTPVDYLVFARWSKDSNVAFTTTRSLRFGLEKKLSDLRNKKVFTEPKFSELSKIELNTLSEEKKASEKITLEKDDKGVWRSSGKTSAKLISTEVEGLINTLQNLSVTGFASDDSKDRENFGLRNPQASITLTARGNAKSITWSLGRAEEKIKSPTVKIEKTYKWYFAKSDDPTTYAVSQSYSDHFKLDVMRFREKSVLSLKKDEVRELNFGDEKQNLQFKKEATNWLVRLNTDKGDGVWKKAKAAAVEAALERLSNLQAASFIDGPTAISYSGLKIPYRTLDIKTASDTPVTLFFGRKVRSGEYAVRSSNLDSVAVVQIQLDELLPLKLDHFAEEEPKSAPENATSSGTASGAVETKAKGGHRVKLEATVKNLSEIKKLPVPIVKGGHKYTAEMLLDNGQKMVIELHSTQAPYTTSNFIHLARNGFYDGVVYHRVVPNFVIQAGDPSSRGAKFSSEREAQELRMGMGGPGYQFNNEETGLTHKRGTLAMANAGRDTNGSQFYVCIAPQPQLDRGYTMFGQVIEGDAAIDSVKVGTTIKKIEVFDEALK